MVTADLTVVNACHNIAARNREIDPDSDKERATMPKETTHRDPEKRAARIERRAKKRAETANRKRLMRAAKVNRSAI